MHKHLESLSELLRSSAIDAQTRQKAEFEHFLKALINCPGKRIFIGVGKSAHIARLLAASFSSCGMASFFEHASELMHGDLGAIEQEDLPIILSFSGQSPEVLAITQQFHRLNIKYLSMSLADSSLAQSALVNIDLSCVKCELLDFGAPTSSCILMLAFGQALLASSCEERGFCAEHFASNHPGGTLGKKLFLRVSDLMHKDNLPLAPHTASLRDALLPMSFGRLGCVVLINAKNKVLGFLSDGDLRRAMQQEGFSLNLAAMDFASHKPCFINAQALAHEAFKKMHEQKISALLVLSESGELEGILHLHDELA